VDTNKKVYNRFLGREVEVQPRQISVAPGYTLRAGASTSPLGVLKDKPRPIAVGCGSPAVGKAEDHLAFRKS